MTAIRRIRGFTSPRSLGNINFIMPTTTGLVGLFLMGGTLADTLRNRAPGSPSPGVITASTGQTLGAPTLNAFSAILGMTAAINTGLADTADYSIVTVARKHPTLLKTYAGNINGSVSSTGHASVSNRASDGRLGQRTFTSATSRSVNSGLGSLNEDFQIAVATCDSDAGGTVLKEYQPGALAVPRTDTVTGARTVLSTAPWWIGADPNSGTASSPVEKAFLAIYSRAITSNEVDAIAAYLRSWFGTRLGNALA